MDLAGLADLNATTNWIVGYAEALPDCNHKKSWTRRVRYELAPAPENATDGQLADYLMAEESGDYGEWSVPVVEIEYVKCTTAPVRRREQLIGRRLRAALRTKGNTWIPRGSHSKAGAGEPAPNLARSVIAKHTRRFWSLVRRTSPDACWSWCGRTNEKGYGRFRFTDPTARSRRPEIMAHRFAYQCVKGPIPATLQLHHACENERCVNPAHLKAVTMKENLLRSPHALKIAVEKALLQKRQIPKQLLRAYARAQGIRIPRAPKAGRG